MQNDIEFDLASWCREMAILHRSRAKITVRCSDDVEPAGLCAVINRWCVDQFTSKMDIDEKDALWDRFDSILEAIDALPQRTDYASTGYKFPQNDEGFDLRADWLEEFANKLDVKEVNNVVLD